MKTYFYRTCLLLLVFSQACQTNQEQAQVQNNDEPISSEESLHPFVEKIQQAHKTELFKEKDAVQFDITLFFGGKERLNAQVIMHTNSGEVLLTKREGTRVIYDGKDVYVSPDTALYGGARFDALTWAYFFAAPHKFNDSGTVWEELDDQKLDSTSYPSAKLTFEGQVGDSPDDWYIAYRQSDNDLLYALAYIVTFGKSVEEANAAPHAITYENYQEVDGVPFASEWKFWEWSEEEGISDEIGQATIANIKFVQTNENTFALPENNQMVAMPE